MYWKESFLGIYIEYIFWYENVDHEKGIFGIDTIPVHSNSWGKYKFSHISVSHDFLGFGDSLLDITAYATKRRILPRKAELDNLTPEKQELENLRQFTTKDSKRRLYFMNIKTPTFESFFNTYSEGLKSNKLLFDVELKDALRNLNQIQNNLRNVFSIKSFGYELIKSDLYNLIRNTSECIPKLNPLVNELIELSFESVFDLPKYENNFLFKYDHFLSLFEKLLQQQYLTSNMLDNFSSKEAEQKYMMFKSDFEKSGLFLTNYENKTIDILNGINISIADLRNTVEYYGQQQVRTLDQMNSHLENIENNSQKMVGSLDQLVKNTGATNFILALQFIQGYRRNKILRKLENNSNII